MAGDPLPITLPADQWTKVASGVFTGNVHRKSTKPTLYLQSYRIVSLGNPAPAVEDDGMVLFEQFTSELIESPEAIDVYIWPKGAAGRVMVAV